MKTDEPRRFESVIEDEGAGVFVVTWREHIDGASLGRHLESLAEVVSSREACFLLVDATQVSGYDLDTRIVARNWSRTGRTDALRAVAIVAGSRLAAAESPASVLAPASTVRLFDSVHPARRWLQHLALAASGEYPRIAVPGAKREVG
jgi:hypothetical protein